MSRFRTTSGVTLIELMIAMLIGLFLIGAIISVYLSSKDTQRTTDTIARMQENGRLALRMVADDLLMAGFTGRNSNPSMIDRRKGSAGQLAATSGSGTAVSDCADRWYIDTATILTVGNDSNPYSAAGTCLEDVDYRPGTDVIAVKRASTKDITNPGSADHANWLLLRTDLMRGEFFLGGGTEPTGYTSYVDRRWLAHVYFIADDGDVPILRSLMLGSGPNLYNRELARGIQDLQIQYGVDTDGDDSPDQFVEPDTISGTANIVAARIWVLVRSEDIEAGHDDSTHTYQYAARSYTPGDGSTIDTATNPKLYRRMLMSTTVDLRNNWN